MWTASRACRSALEINNSEMRERSYEAVMSALSKTRTAKLDRPRNLTARPGNAMARWSRARNNGTAWRKRLHGNSGAQLLEFALAMPLLLVLAIGIIDFGGAFNVRHILTNAAREAARVTVSNSLSNSGGNCQNATTPCSIQAAADSVKQYLTRAGLNTASCITPGSPSGTGTLTWTYTCNNVTLIINHGFVVAGGPSGTLIPSTQVTLSYPFTFTYGKVIGLLVSGGTGSSGQQILSTTVVMQNLSSD